MPSSPLSAEQRLLLLDTWRRSGLPAGDFAALVGISKQTLYGWKKKFDNHGPAGLMDQPRGGARSSRLPDLTKRTILNAQGDQSQLGLSEDQRHVAARSSSARQRFGRGPRAARGWL